MGIVLGGVVVANTTSAVRVLETSHPPAWYVPCEAFRDCVLRTSDRRTFCEFKGVATYVTLVAGGVEARDAAWTYERPARGYERLAGMLAVYPARVDRCLVDDELVCAQPGDFYGGWITADVVGPFKGGRGTAGW